MKHSPETNSGTCLLTDVLRFRPARPLVCSLNVLPLSRWFRHSYINLRFAFTTNYLLYIKKKGMCTQKYEINSYEDEKNSRFLWYWQLQSSFVFVSKLPRDLTTFFLCCIFVVGYKAWLKTEINEKRIVYCNIYLHVFTSK